MIGFYFITDRVLSRRGNLSDVKSALRAGVKFIQYREKYASTAEMLKEALCLKRICNNAVFLVNDRVDIALAVNADGVHIGKDDMPYAAARKLLGKKKIIGVTVHSLREAKAAEKSGADYLGVSPVFASSTKKDAGKPAGVRLIKKIKKRVSIPLIAIGGINLKNAPSVISSGADGLSAISAVVTKPEVKEGIKKFQRLFE